MRMTGIHGPDLLKVSKTMDVLGPRFKVRYGSSGRNGYAIEVVEGDDETVYRIEARSVEQMCGLLLKKVFEDKAKAAGGTPIPEEPFIALSGSTSAMMSEVEKLKKELEAFRAATKAAAFRPWKGK